jgi:glycosyltransferase involved in cell wall biosynthesis
MGKPTLLYASPFAPLKSGISDYSAALVQGLREHFEITLGIDDYELEDRTLLDQMKVVRLDRDNLDWPKYDFKLYNIGNNPWYHGRIYAACLEHPGVVILHDFVLYYLIIGHYMNRPEFYTKLFEIAGPLGLRFIKDMKKDGVDLLTCRSPHLLPLTRELLVSGNSVVCHSRYTVAKCKELAPANIRLGHIKHLWHSAPTSPEARTRLLASWNIPDDAILAVSLGFVAPTKLNHLVCEAVRRHNRRSSRKVCYVMVGEGDYVRDSLDEFIRITGFVASREFADWAAASDIVINLRHPTMGETSGATLHALGAGKPCVVTDEAWFSELEDDIVIKIRPVDGDGVVSGVEEVLRHFVEMPEAFRSMGARAKKILERDYSVDAASLAIAKFVIDGKTVVSR